MRGIVLLGVIFLYCGGAIGAEPDPPVLTPQPVAAAKTPDRPLTFRDFLHDRAQMSAFGVGFSAKSFDLGQTLWHRANYQHFHEDWMPAQGPAGITLSVLGSEAGATFVQYRFYKAGHKRLAIATQLLSGAASALGSAYSFRHARIIHLPASSAPSRAR